MRYIKKFNEGFLNANDAVELRDKYNELKEAKIKIYESMNPPMIEVYEDWSDYLLELKDKYGEVTSPYGDVRDIIDISGLDLDVDIESESDYTVAHEYDYVYQGGHQVDKDPRDIPIEKKLSIYASDFDWEFLRYYQKHNGQVNPFYSFMIAFDSDYKGGRKENWSDEDTHEMTQELVSLVKNVMKRLGAKIVKLETFDGAKWSLLSSKNLDDVKYPRFKIGFRI